MGWEGVCSFAPLSWLWAKQSFFSGYATYINYIVFGVIRKQGHRSYNRDDVVYANIIPRMVVALMRYGPLRPWWYGSWIYNYLCNKCPSPLMLRVRISIRVRCTILCDKFVSDLRQVGGGFFRVLKFPPSIKLTATTYLKNDESGVKHNQNEQTNLIGYTSLVL